jgi:RHS repeat-associated protein
LPDKDAYNPYRFNAKRWDAASGTYDMGFRDYNPGLNRFTTRDMYNGALDDMGLGADAFTGNRYAFGGGNPISMVELDGHTSCEATGMCGGVYRVTPEQRAANRQQLLNPSRVVQINKLEGGGSLKGKSEAEQNAIAESQVNKATGVLGDMYEKFERRYEWVNAQIARFDVKHGDGTTSQRVAVFISGKGKLPPEVLKELTVSGIAVLQPGKTAGTKGAGHSEAVGAAIRNGRTLSARLFGGTLGHVSTSISANPSCSAECGKDQSIFTKVKIRATDVGLLNDQVYTANDKKALTNVAGTKMSFLQVRYLQASGYNPRSMLYFTEPESAGEPE